MSTMAKVTLWLLLMVSLLSTLAVGWLAWRDHQRLSDTADLVDSHGLLLKHQDTEIDALVDLADAQAKLTMALSRAQRTTNAVVTRRFAKTTAR